MTETLRDRLAEACYAATAWGGCAGARWELVSEQFRARHYDAADALLPVVAQEVAAAEQRGREEVRARVERVLIQWWPADIPDMGSSDCAQELRVALAEPAPEDA